MDIDYSELYVEPYKILGMSCRTENNVSEITSEETSKTTEDSIKDWNINLDDFSMFKLHLKIPSIKRLPYKIKQYLQEKRKQDTQSAIHN